MAIGGDQQPSADDSFVTLFCICIVFAWNLRLKFVLYLFVTQFKVTCGYWRRPASGRQFCDTDALLSVTLFALCICIVLGWYLYVMFVLYLCRVFVLYLFLATDAQFVCHLVCFLLGWRHSQMSPTDTAPVSYISHCFLYSYSLAFYFCISTVIALYLCHSQMTPTDTTPASYISLLLTIICCAFHFKRYKVQLQPIPNLDRAAFRPIYIILAFR